MRNKVTLIEKKAIHALDILEQEIVCEEEVGWVEESPRRSTMWAKIGLLALVVCAALFSAGTTQKYSNKNH